MSEPAHRTETASTARSLGPAERARIVAAARGPKSTARTAAKPGPMAALRAPEEPSNTNGFNPALKALSSGKTFLEDPRLPGIRVFFELLTPELAEHYLQKLPKRQRKQSENTIDRYAGDMASEQWVFIADAIRFNADGELIDGQHRCRAVLESGVPQMTLVAIGLDHEAITVFDTGRPRRFTDVLAMEGVANASAVATVTKRVFDWQRGNYGVPNIGRYPNAPFVGVPASPGKLYETFDNLRAPIQHAARRGMALKGNCGTKTASGSVLSLVYLIFGEFDIERRELFFHELEYGPAQNNPENPMYVLRERLKKNVPPAQSGLPDWVWLHFFFTTWNKVLLAESMGPLRTPARASYSHVAQPNDPHADARPEGWQPLGGIAA